MTESDQKVTVFSVHVPKTGGTSFLKLLEQHYGNGLLIDYGTPKQEVLQKISEEGIRCVHGHYHALKYADVTDSYFIAWVRNPIDRLVSHYNFWKAYKFPQYEIWREFDDAQMSFMEFALWDRGRNGQNNFLSGIDFDRFQVIGVAEFYEESVQLFKRKLGMNFETGSTPHLRKADKEKSAFHIDSLSRSDIARIMEAHQADFVLYLKALTRFRELIAPLGVEGS